MAFPAGFYLISEYVHCFFLQLSSYRHLVKCQWIFLEAYNHIKRKDLLITF